MKYKEGNIVALNNGKSVYIFSVDEKKKKYQVVDTEDENKIYMVSESEIFMFLTQYIQLLPTAEVKSKEQPLIVVLLKA